MLGFSPFKKHANKFNYIPRYYDPAEEERNRRRAELRGETPEMAGREYEPGQYIRTARMLRAERREREQAVRGRRRLGTLAAGIVLMLGFLTMLYPKIVRLADGSSRRPAVETVGTGERPEPRNDLDQSGITDAEWREQTITVVPDDYEGV